MSSNLVRLTTQHVSQGVPTTTSRQVAEDFKKNHKSVLRTIENLTAQNGAVKNMFIETEYVSERGQTYREYLISYEGFSLLVMGFTGKEALEWKLKYIKAFELMRKELQARQETRHLGILVRKSLTDTIKNSVDDGNFKNYAYSNYSKLILKKILGNDVKKLKQERKVPDGKNIRDYLTIEELEKIQEAEGKVATYIEMRKNIINDKEIYQEIKEIL